MDMKPTVILPPDDQMWFWEILIGLFVLVALNYVIKRIVKHIRQRSLSTKSDWREKLDYIFFLPVHVTLWVLGGILVLEILARRFEFSFFNGYLSSFRITMIIGCIAWVLLRWSKEVQRTLLNHDRPFKKVDAAFVQVVGKILSVVVAMLSAMIILQVWGLNVAPLIAFGGIGAAAVGFAGKDVIANFFGGLMLYVTRPFMAGDSILIPDRNLDGQVEEIGWYLTSVRDKDKRPVYLPNAIFSSTLVINASRMTHRRIEEKIGVRYEDFPKIKAIVEEVRQAITAHSQIDTHLPIIVYFNALNQYSLDIYVDVYTLATRYDHYLTVKQEILLLVYEIVKAKEAELAFPTFVVQGSLQQV